ncbi:MAG: T9SS type A sorting domain-containing protein [Bacteroidetes bacterium]|nr:T9SS type A sorting domain-containing protein [Bacteroidota bacterium]
MFKLILNCFAVLFISASSLSAQWVQSTGIPQSHVVYSIIQCSGKLFAATGVVNLEYGAILSSTDNGVSWGNVDVNQPNLSAVMCLVVKGTYIFAGTYRDGLLISSNAGNNWIRTDVTTAGSIFQITICGNNIVCYTTGNGPSRISTDNGATWNTVSENVLKYVNSFLTIGNTFYAGAEKGLAFSIDDGLTWSLAANNGIPFDGNGQKLIYSLVSHDGKIFANCQQKIFYTTDNGNNWIATNISLSNFGRVYSMISYNGKIFGSMYGLSDTARGVITTTNNGINWSNLNTGMPGPPSVRSLFINNEFLLAGTYSGTIYRMPLSAVTGLNNSPEIVKHFSLQQNYPNPFNPETKINFVINKKDLVSLKVYGSDGKLVFSLVNKEVEVGNYSFTFSGENLPSGIYFYELKAGAISDTKKMILVK